MKKIWTQDEIDYIKKAYAEGRREKVIALDLGRSESSVSKKLTRFGLRCKRNYSILKRSYSHNRNKVKRSVVIKTVHQATTFNNNPCNWTSVEEILRYLGENSPCFYIKYRNYKPVYVFQNQEISLTKVLMETNRIRIAEGQPIFHLDEVTE